MLHNTQASTQCPGADLQTLIAADTAASERVELLRGLSEEAPSAERLFDLASLLRRHCVHVPGFEEHAIDLCGTGGDHSGTFNISTAASIVAAADGVVVAKHGNRAVSGRTGSADCLEALGIRCDLDAAQCCQMLQATDFAFMSAPRFHTAVAHVMPARRRLAAEGRRTLFNIVGPLINPAGVRHQVMGVYDPELLEPVAGALQRLGVRRALVICGHGMDEATLDGPTRIVRVGQDELEYNTLHAAELGLAPCGRLDLQAADAQLSAAIVRGVLDGSLRGGHRDIVILNAALAIHIGAADHPTLQRAVERAALAIDSGAAVSKLQHLILFSQSLTGARQAKRSAS